MGKIPQVAIIGAGLSGLRCADVLGQNGVHVTIFEARDRVGGRVCFLSFLLLLPFFFFFFWVVVVVVL